ncbi:MAG: ABC transporter permease subunit/CPBP intramembrane protease [Planctomycetota bacterium]
MNLRNVTTVWHKELRDQLRDRRTLFMVLVLPLVMYPLMGMSLLQFAQFLKSHEPTVLVVGSEQLNGVEGLPPLVDGDRFATALAGRGKRAKMQLERIPMPTEGSPNSAGKDRLRLARAELIAGELDAVVIFPEGFAEKLKDLQRELALIGEGVAANEIPDPPKPIVQFNSSRDGSRLTYFEVDRLLSAWRSQIVGRNLAASQVPAEAIDPFKLEANDVAPPAAKAAGVWPKLLPFAAFLWALTGAFYPAVDLCAGEKERGTLETLLVSPATRGEIVWGKLLTVITFSLLTGLLNLLVVSAVGGMVSDQLAGMGPAGAASPIGKPPLASLAWLVVALPPVAALFSALSLACAAFARSTKEGQYYFMPVFLGVLPLILLPLSPGVELNLGNALAPVMGLMLLLRSLMEGDVLEAVRYAVPVTAVTFGCCLLAIRWAVSQFNQESVLFRGEEKLDLRLWLMSLVKRREQTPTVGMAVACIAAILLVQFVLINTVLSRLPPPGSGFGWFSLSAFLSQMAVLLPPLVLAAVLLRDRRRTFKINALPNWRIVAAAAGLAVLLNPMATLLSNGIQKLYPLAEGVEGQLALVQADLASAPSPILVFALLALLPAVVEELAFRGFVLTGLQKSGSNRWAVVLSAIAFGVAHTVLQQSLTAMLVGLLIGCLAVVTRSLYPCIAFHLTHNGLPVFAACFGGEVGGLIEKLGLGGLILRAPDGGFLGYHPVVTVAGVVLAAGVWRWIARQSAPSSERPATDEQPTPPPLASRLAAPETSEG